MKKLVFSILFVLQAFFVFAQETSSITGKIVDSKSQKAIQSIVVSVQNSTLVKLTNEQGIFTIDNVPVGEHLILVRSSGYSQQLITVEVFAGQVLDLGIISFEEDITSEQQLSLVTITDSDLGDDNSGSENTAGLLQASRDAFQQVSAFNWGQARFRIRGLDNEYGVTMINGIVMNKIYDGRPQWSNWGGLNDATRNQEFTMGSGTSDYSFGGSLGTQQIHTRASLYRPGSRVTFSGTNTNYSWRAMGTHASGMNENGWAYVISASRRWAEEGYFDGTDYAANSVFASVEKKFNNKHSLNLTSIYAQNSRGKTSPNTAEVNDLMGVKYNSYWGWQNGKKRNSRDKDIEEPMVMLSHYWKISDKTILNTNVAFQTGTVGNSRLDYQLGNNPDKTYYKNLPSYFNNLGGYSEDQLTSIGQDFQANAQLDWNAMYFANSTSAYEGRSVYVLYEDRTDDNLLSANSILNSSIADNITLNAGANFKKLRSHNHQNLLDLMGGQYFLDVDTFFTGDSAQSDLNNPNRQVGEGDTYGYDYLLHALTFDGFTQFKFTYDKINFYLAQSFSRTEYQREGLYKNGIYANNSYGKGESITFENFGFKGGLTYKLTGRHYLNFNGLYQTKAPGLRNTFSNARLNNVITPDITSETVTSADASYIIRMPKLKARITGFYSNIKDASKISFYYGEFAEEGGDSDTFVSEILTGIDKQNMGAELGIEYQITSTVKATAAASYGQYIYSDNAKLKINDDALAQTSSNTLVDLGTAYLKDYFQPGMPQKAASLGLEYRAPQFWWIGANVNYLSDSYIDVSSVLRTDNFTISPGGDSYAGATPEAVKAILKQEKFDAFTLVNLTGGKSWRISNKNRNTVGFFASVNNVFDIEYKTGGFEQSRKANFSDLQADNLNGTPSFGPKYFYGYGRTFFVNLYINL